MYRRYSPSDYTSPALVTRVREDLENLYSLLSSWRAPKADCDHVRKLAVGLSILAKCSTEADCLQLVREDYRNPEGIFPGDLLMIESAMELDLIHTPRCKCDVCDPEVEIPACDDTKEDS